MPKCRHRITSSPVPPTPSRKLAKELKVPLQVAQISTDTNRSSQVEDRYLALGSMELLKTFKNQLKPSLGYPVIQLVVF